jgi:excisionase family DNA binding protein
MSYEHARGLAEKGTAGVEEACRFLGIGRTNLYALMGSGELKFIKLGARRLIPRAELERFLTEQLTAAR